eukprot:3504076-Rhodomonas_salina.3
MSLVRGPGRAPEQVSGRVVCCVHVLREGADVCVCVCGGGVVCGVWCVVCAVCGVRVRFAVCCVRSAVFGVQRAVCVCEVLCAVCVVRCVGADVCVCMVCCVWREGAD